jgi:hypothetical protein
MEKGDGALDWTDNDDYPSENCGLLVFGIIQSSSLERFCCLDHEKAGLVLTAERVVVETLGTSDKLPLGGRGFLTHTREIFDGVLWHRMRLQLRKQKSADGRIQDLELVPRNGTCHGGGGPMTGLGV